MPRLQYNGEYYRLTVENAEKLKTELESLVSGGSITLSMPDMDGDEAWLYIPYGAPLSIRYFD